MAVAEVVDDVESGDLGAWAEDAARGLDQGADLRIAIPGGANRLGVDPERDVVEKEVAAHLADIDPALDAVAESVKAGDWIGRIQPEVSGEVVAGPRRHANERQVTRQRAVATGASDPSPPATASASAPPARASSIAVARFRPGRTPRR